MKSTLGSIKLVDVATQNGEIKNELLAKLSEVIDAGRLILGEQVQEFERAFSALHRRAHGIGVASGTDALTLSLHAIGIEPGDEVIVPDMTFFATASAVFRMGARPVPVDVEPEGLRIDCRLIEQAITKKTKAIIPVHLHGWPVAMDPILDLADKLDLKIIEDCAQAHGAQSKGCPIGRRGTTGCVSFFPSKNLGALGDGGMVITDDAELTDRIRRLANQGRSEKYLHQEVGYNSRLDELQAAFLNVKLKYLKSWNNRRREIASIYRTALAETPLIHPPAADGEDLSCVHIYAVRCKDSHTRDGLQAFLKDKGIETGIHYPVPLHLQSPFSGYHLSSDNYPVSTCASRNMLSFPVFPEMTDGQCAEVIGRVSEFFFSQ
jgi:dTDP-4-amino-4,6-dideoxygalactose transaminase